MRIAFRIASGILVGAALTAPAQAGGFWSWMANIHSGGDDFAPGTRNSAPETNAEHQKSKYLECLDGRGLAAYAEADRVKRNYRILAAYNRGFAATTTGGEPASEPSLVMPSVSPPRDTPAPIAEPITPPPPPEPGTTPKPDAKPETPDPAPPAAPAPDATPVKPATEPSPRE